MTKIERESSAREKIQIEREKERERERERGGEREYKERQTREPLGFR